MKGPGKGQHACNAAGAQRPGPRPLHDSLAWGEGGPSKNPAQGRGLEGDVDVRVVSEDKTHRVCSLKSAASDRAAPHNGLHVPRLALDDFIRSFTNDALEVQRNHTIQWA